jgi:predicted nucleic acid-binding protein
VTSDAEASTIPRAVLDTSVLFSQHRHWLWLLAHLGYFQGIWSTFIVGELVRIRVEHSIRLGVERTIYRQRVNDLVHLLSDVLEVASYRDATTGGQLRDPDDEPILATALAGSATHIVSLNTRDFPENSTVLGVQFVTPQEFLSGLISRHPNDDLERQAEHTGRQLP